MPKLRVLSFQYNLDKKLKAFKSLSSSLRDRDLSDLFVRYEPNEDEMRKVFDKISNLKEKIEEDDLRRLVRMTHTCHLQGDEKKVCEAEQAAKQMLGAADLNRDGAVDFGEFMEVNRKNGVRSKEIKSAFWTFDHDGDGRISAEDIQKMMKRLGESCTLEECKRMVRHVDKNHDGVVDMDEFMEMMTRTMKLM